MSKKRSIDLGHIARKVVFLLREHLGGLSMAEMREMLGETALAQRHFNRRVREIRKLYVPRQAGWGADGAGSMYLASGSLKSIPDRYLRNFGGL